MQSETMYLPRLWNRNATAKLKNSTAARIRCAVEISFTKLFDMNGEVRYSFAWI